MKITASISYSDSARACQVSAELELNDQVTADILSARTCELLKGLQAGISNGTSGKALIDITPMNDKEALPIGGTASSKRKQRPDDPVSPKQLKYLNDLLHANGLDLASWCREKHAAEDQITASNCQQWIPELKDRLDNRNMPF